MPVPMYTSHAFSPIIEGNPVIFHVGGHNKGALTAFDLNTGAGEMGVERRRSGLWLADRRGLRRRAADRHDYAGQAGRGQRGHRRLLWEQALVSPNFTNSITPVRLGDTVIAWGHGGPMTAFSVARDRHPVGNPSGVGSVGSSRAA